jgi:hypothetical protein
MDSIKEINMRIADKEAELKRLVAQREAIKTAKFPARVEIYANTDRDYMYNVGEKLGLAGKELDTFSYADEWTLVIKVDADGTATLMMEEIKS